jgi:Holliday junction resolvase
MTKQYKYGREKEQKVARSLRSRGAKVDVSKGSKGAADVKVKFSTGTKWNVQVKSTRSGTAAGPSKKDVGRLKQSASKSRATPVIAKVSPKGIEYTSARSGRKLTPPKKKK